MSKPVRYWNDHICYYRIAKRTKIEKTIDLNLKRGVSWTNFNKNQKWNQNWIRMKFCASKFLFPFFEKIFCPFSYKLGFHFRNAFVEFTEVDIVLLFINPGLLDHLQFVKVLDYLGFIGLAFFILKPYLHVVFTILVSKGLEYFLASFLLF